MFLKRLETVGFKSFAERIQMDFVPGVTAVVGPNGSGKSNVIDAIRWVLGEQSAKSLRGQKMEDIIFQGSDSRKPLNFAEVALILNNEAGHLPIDYQEINVTRRVYRSGESEFLINKQSCRLKDIVDLFMDTGLGRESFSIIGQGRIDEILSSKAEERRAVFEEAAGVLKYKQRKNKAEFKLQETTDNLDRVEDIIYEIEQQIEPLQQQAATAKQYEQYKKQLKEIEVALLATEIEQLHASWQSMLREIEADKFTEIKRQTVIQEKEAKITKQRNEAQQLEQSMTELQQALLSVTEQLEQLEGKRNVLKERSKHAEENKQKLMQEEATYTDHLEQIEQTMLTEREQLANIVDSIEQVVDEKKELNNQLTYGPAQVHEQIEDLKSDYIEYLNEQAVLQNEGKSVEKQILHLQQQKEQQLLTYKDSLDEEKQLEMRKNALEQELQALHDAIKSMEAEFAQIEEKIKLERMNYEAMQNKLFAGNEQIAKLTSRKEMLEEMRESFQGFFYGVKEILKAKEQRLLQNIAGAVVDLIQVPGKYITAIDTILGAQAQYIVVPNDRVARQTIQWLKKENKGRATFLPLESIEKRAIHENILKNIEHERGFIGIATQLIEIEPGYEKVAEYLLGNVIVAEHLEAANQLAVITNRKYRIVTVDGDVVYPGGSMSGGAKRKNNSTLFSREKEIIDLTEKLADFSERATNYEQKVEEQRQTLISLEEARLQLAEKVEKEKQAANTTQTKLREMTVDYHRRVDQLASYRSMSEQQEEQKERLKQQYDQLQEQLQATKQSIAQIEKEIEQRTEEKAHLEANKKQTENRLHELEIKNAELEERKNSRTNQLQSYKDQQRMLSDQLTDIKKQIGDMMDERERREREQEIAEKLMEYKTARQTISEQLEAERKKRSVLVQKTDDEEREIKGLTSTLADFAKTIQQKEVKANRLDVTLENYLTTLQNEYRMTFERAKEQYAQVKDLAGAKEKVKSIKTAIERLGTVNLGAIDEYERIRERYEFLKNQQADLMEAKQTLYEVIQEMDEEMTRRFTTVFEDIQMAFSAVFTQLFGGGHAALSLTDPDNLLETGIEIVARPPGKKLKTLGLLSGGERALTAIALLFAILRVRPVPFCILDEVDAALDEANVERFGTYLKSFRDETQFIVITHRKGTMEEADALYGITMQESGVSRLVSVKLEESNHLMEVTQ